MIPSQTVENYLKTIFLAQSSHGAGDDLVPMGQIAAGLGVVPGTATTMIKTLAESGLVHYEPYMGVRLTPAGEKLASLVLRRHRLIEHDEAERLEHAVSERLIDRIDDMLGRPAVDPHGDPIPTAEGTIARHDHVDLMTAGIDTPLVVTRILDQDPEFLRFAETRRLIPGASIVVRERHPAADSVRLELPSGDVVTIGTRAASKVLVTVG
jgi:DtxR family Mn-dependent transcriptional regulator